MLEIKKIKCVLADKVKISWWEVFQVFLTLYNNNTKKYIFCYLEYIAFLFRILVQCRVACCDTFKSIGTAESAGTLSSISARRYLFKRDNNDILGVVYQVYQ